MVLTAEQMVREAARRKLVWFARYMKGETFSATPFHTSYYAILDAFARKKIYNLIIQAPPQHGKALKVDTPVLTTKGWKKHGDLEVGDYVFGMDGKPRKVKWNSGKYKCESQYVHFADGFSLCSARQHEWMIYADRDNHKGRVVETLETQEIFAKRHRRKPYIPSDAVLEMPHRDLPVTPYLLGLWLGDGNSKNKWITCGAEDLEHLRPLAIEIKQDKNAYSVHLNGLSTRQLRLLGVLYNKHIPIEYLLASESQRRELLRGLMDTDGCVDARGSCEFCQKSGQLAEDVYVLLRTLGYKPTRHEYDSKLYGKVCGKKTRIIFKPDKCEKIFDIPRKQYRIDCKQQGDRTDKKRFFISSVEDCEDSLVNCIEVEGGMYLAGKELVPTHNSEGSTRFLPAYVLGLDPDTKIGVASYTSTVAEGFNRDVQRLIDTDRYASVFPDTSLNRKNVVAVSSGALRNSTTFEIVGHLGGLHAVGRGGPLTSKAIDLMIMDDLYKDASEGNSPIIRDAAWQWYTKVVLSRLHNESQQLIAFTRWNKDDIIGRILESGAKIHEIRSFSDLDNIERHEWAFVNFEAIKTGKKSEIDQREEGEALWEERHSKARLMEKREIDPVGFECLYQGNPGNSEGKMYSPFKTYTDKKEYGSYVRSGCYVDVADQGNDYLCAVAYEIYRSPNRIWNEQRHRFDPILYALVTDVEFTDKGTDVTYYTVPDLINRNGVQRVWVESNAGGSQFEKNIRRRIRAVTKPFYQSQNKEARITTNAASVNSFVVFPIGWEEKFPKFHDHIANYLREFKANPHDDGADCLTGIYEKETQQDLPYRRNKGIRVH